MVLLQQQQSTTVQYSTCRVFVHYPPQSFFPLPCIYYYVSCTSTTLPFIPTVCTRTGEVLSLPTTSGLPSQPKSLGMTVDVGVRQF